MNALSAFEQIKLLKAYDAAMIRIAELEKQIRLAALEKWESPPIEPEEVYSPSTVVINE